MPSGRGRLAAPGVAGRLAKALVACVALSGLAGGAAWAERIDTAGAIAVRAEGAGILILGEVHDNPAHHRMQDRVLDAIMPRAIVFEMLTQAEAAVVTPELAADARALEAALDWDASGWPDFAMYLPLLARAATVPIYGAEVPRDLAQDAFAAGAAAVFAGDAARFGLTRPLDPAQQAAREAAQQAAHCGALPDDILPAFVEAQRLRDAALAAAALEALEAHGAPVAIVTGNGHARRDWGVPAQLALAAPGVRVFSLGQFEAPPQGAPPFDAWTVADPVDRPDPCAAFR
jgi:uncharacterized iron-regulated protein